MCATAAAATCFVHMFAFTPPLLLLLLHAAAAAACQLLSARLQQQMLQQYYSQDVVFRLNEGMVEFTGVGGCTQQL